MIYDGHAYCFPSLHGDGGFQNKEDFKKYQQVAISHHFQPVWVDSNRSIITDTSKINPANKWSIDSLKNTDFSPSHRGRYEWTHDGIKYVKQYMPPSIKDMSYSADDLVAEMDYAGVDMALLHRMPYLGIGNEFISNCIKTFPDRLQGLAHIPEWEISSNIKFSINTLNDAIENLHLSGLQFLPDQLDLHNKKEQWDDTTFDPFWSAFSDLNVPLFITQRFTALTSNSDLVGVTNNELSRVKKWMNRFPKVKVIWTHGLAWRLFRTEKDLTIPSSVFQSAPVDNPNFYLQLMFPISLGDIWEYPMKQIISPLKEISRNFGADRLIWGTDMPIVLRHFTYKQCLDQIKIHGKEVLTNEEIELICGGTMQKLMNLKA